ncbi:MAG: PAS domain S-box protein [Spirochaetes bacterium]|nr:PAS domain S-box protein [Spirochaetota bacterium]MBU1081457.1 PAS domain S-box protein [Spirochaetota bacterium]
MSGARKTVLVVDDVPDDIMILEEILKAEYRVKAVTNGEAALAIARSDSPPDLILLDIMMPGMDGFEVCRHIKSDASGSAIPIVFLTAKQMSSDEKAAFAIGAADYIRKPVDPELVLARVNAHLERKGELVHASEIRYRRLFEASVDGVMIVDIEAGRVIDANPSMARLLGTTQESFLGEDASSLAPLADIVNPKGRMPLLARREYVRETNVPIETFDGRCIYVEYTCNPYLSDRRETIQLTLRDITALTEAQRSRDELAARLARYLATSPTITYSLCLDGASARFVWISENVTRILGYSMDEAMAPDWWFGHIDREDRARALEGVSELSKGDSFSQEYRFIRKDGSTLWLLDEMRLIRGADGAIEIVGSLTDIDERKRAEEELQLKGLALESSLRDKSALLREVHHRVKNNMQIISSLLSLSSGEDREPGVQRMLSSVTRRIEAMAIAHAQLYNSEDLEYVDFTRYLKELALGLVRGGGAAASSATVEFECDAVRLSLEEAIPAGLIASELLSNSVRFALGDQSRPGTLRISMRMERDPAGPGGGDGVCTMELSDDGPGLPAGLDSRAGSTLGMRLVGILADQLHGEIAFDSGRRGTRGRLRFPVLGYRLSSGPPPSMPGP